MLFRFQCYDISPGQLQWSKLKHQETEYPVQSRDSMILLLSIEWNLIRVDGPADEIVTI